MGGPLSRDVVLGCPNALSMVISLNVTNVPSDSGVTSYSCALLVMLERTMVEPTTAPSTTGFRLMISVLVKLYVPEARMIVSAFPSPGRPLPWWVWVLDGRREGRGPR